MSDDLFVKTYRVVFKESDNAFHVKYHVEPKQGDKVQTTVAAKVNDVKVQNIAKTVKETPMKQKSPEKKHQQKAEQVNQKSGKKKKNLKKVLEMKQEDFQIYSQFNKLNFKKIKYRKIEENIAHTKAKKSNKKYNKMVMKDIEDQSQEELDQLYNLLLQEQQEFAKKTRKSRSIDNYQSKNTTLKYKKNIDEKKKKVLYDSYVNIDDILESRAEGQKKYYKGYIDFNERAKYFAKIFSKEIQGELIAEEKHRNRCIHGDQVYFEILNQMAEKESNDKKKSDKIKCKIVSILPWKRGNQRRKIVGKVEYNRNKNTYYLNPINKRITSFDIKFSDISKENLKKVNKKYFLAEFTQWKQTDEFPSCRVLSEFGELGDIQTETGALLINNGVEDEEYDEQIIQEGLSKFIERIDESGEYKISDEEIKKRKDLRNQRIFTIDPLTARDFDDALSITQCGTNAKGDKVYEIGVHIADASFFVEEGGLIDQFAQKKTTSVYLVHRVLPMLPRILCETMCSLNPGLERLTISVWFKITENGEVLPGSTYDRSVIHSKARFTYEQAQKIINGEVKSQKQIQPGFGCIHEKDFDQIAKDIQIMNKIAMKIRNDRIEGGSLIFEIPKKTFQLDENFYPKSYTINKRFEANFLVQEYMLLANQKVGEILVEKIRPSALLRKHQFPSEKKIQKFQKFTEKIGHPIKVTQDIKIQQKLNEISENPKIKQCIKDILNYELIFLLEQAQYFVVESTQKKTWIHYALNMPVYTHFTSPIRRYPDIIVHRQLCAIIQAEKKGIDQSKIVIPHYNNLKDLVQRCNKNKMNAKKVSSGCEKIFLCLYLKTHPVSCKAILTDLNEYSLNICVPTYDFRSAIEIKELKKMKVINSGQDASERKYLQVQCEYEPQKTTKIILKQMQEVDIRLTAKQGFPIDYLIRLIFPHPKILGQTITYE